MKIFVINIILATLALVYLSSCSGTEEPTTQDKMRAILTSGTWRVESIKVGEEDALDFFPDLAVTFQSESFSASNGAPVWPTSGTWDFSNDEATKIARGDDVEVVIVSLTETRFECSLYWDEYTVEPGRAAAVEGTHTFVFTK